MKLKIFIPYRFIIIVFLIASCKTKKHTPITQELRPTDTINSKCKLEIKTTRQIIKQMNRNTFNYEWIYAKADTKIVIDSEETDVDIKIRSKKDSAILITVEAINLFDVAKMLITTDSVKLIIFPKKQYFYGSIENISKLINVPTDFDLIQSVLFGNNAEFYDEEEKIKHINDKKNCQYILTTTKKRKVKKIIKDKNIYIKELVQIISLDPHNYKIVKNQFIDFQNNQSLIVYYENFQNIDSVFFPKIVKAQVIAENSFNFNLRYSKVDINKPQNLSFRIPPSYEKKEIK